MVVAASGGPEKFSSACQKASVLRYCVPKSISIKRSSVMFTRAVLPLFFAKSTPSGIWSRASLMEAALASCARSAKRRARSMQKASALHGRKSSKKGNRRSLAPTRRKAHKAPFCRRNSPRMTACCSWRGVVAPVPKSRRAADRLVWRAMPCRRRGC